MSKNTFKTIFASGLQYSKSFESAKRMAIMVKDFLDKGGEKITIEVHSKELYELREENDMLRRKLNMGKSSYHNMTFLDEEV